MSKEKKPLPLKTTSDPLLEKISHNATRWIGSVESLIVHTVLFAGMFSLSFFGFDVDKILLILTTILSLEAIYLAIFIQMTVNRNTIQLREVEKDIEEISEDIEDIQEDVEEISEDIEDIQEDVEEISEDIEDIQEDVEEISEDEEQEVKEEELEKQKNKLALEKLEEALVDLLKEIEELKKKK
ncbi:MAG: coiled-coil domain-containing protein [Minisyncoccota bacterium]